MIDFSNLEKYRENNRIEAKKALGGLPKSIWETYSAFANTLGGIILLGVIEDKDKSLHPVNLPDPGRLIEEFWDLINRPEKASANILSDQNVSVETVEGCQIIAITVPQAQRCDRPVFVDGNPLTGTYRRNGEGDYRCTREEVESMLRDAVRKSQDMSVLEQRNLKVFDSNTVSRYRSRMMLRHPGHIWEDLPDEEFLYKLGAVGKGSDGTLHPTAAGLLMFGLEYEIIREYPDYFLDYQDLTAPENGQKYPGRPRRILSSSGDWSGNLLDFYFRVCRELLSRADKGPEEDMADLPDPEKFSVQEALREALTNCLVNADYHGTRGIVICKKETEITFSNPGSFRIAVDDALGGGISDPRNPALCRMFNLIDVGERTGGGIPNIYHVWKRQGWPAPVITQQFAPERITLSLTVRPGRQTDAGNTAADKKERKSGGRNAARSAVQKAVIIEYLTEHAAAHTGEIASLLDTSASHAGRLLSQMEKQGIISREGSGRTRIFRLKS